MSATVREATPADAAGLATLAAITFPLACPPHTTEEAKAAFIRDVLSEERFREYLADPSRRLLVAVEEGPAEEGPAEEGPADEDAMELAGFTMMIFGEPHDTDAAAAIRLHPTAEISKVYVLPGHHGTGVAAGLMTASLTTARVRGAAGVWLGVNNENARACAFYRKHGFEIVGTKRFRVGDRFEDDFVMERAL